MTDPPLEPPPDDLSLLYEAERRAPPIEMPSKVRLLGRIEGAAKAGAAAWTTGKVVSAVVAASLIGAMGGAGLHAAIAPPRVVERLVTRTVTRPSDPADAGARVPIAEPAVTPPVEEASPPPRRPPAPRGLAAERRLLDAARAALARGNLAPAAQALERHRRLFAGGALAEERDALRIEVRVQQGRLDEARRMAEEFEREHPRSLYRPRIQRMIE